jgi:predicted AlkP superfamily pyrophosphatase or phosphodiesterase
MFVIPEMVTRLSDDGRVFPNATAVAMKFPLSALLRTLLLFIILLGAGCASTPVPQVSAAAASRHPLLLISIDGYRADYIGRGLSPTLAALAAGGVRAEAMQSAFPTLTFPNHYTIVTGLVPDHHGIVNNTMEDVTLGRFTLGTREAVSDGRWWSDAEPIWVSADNQGLRTATMFWPGTEAEIRGRRPDYWLPFNGELSADKRVDQVLDWLDLPVGKRPDLLTLYFDAVDHAGHEFGPDSPQVDTSLRETDRALTRLVDGLKQRGLLDRMDIIVVSDHGMAPVPVDHVIMADDAVDLKTVNAVAFGVLAGFNPKPGYDFGKAEVTLLAPHEHMQCWRKSEVPARLNYGTHPRVPAVVCLAQTGWQITTREATASRKKPLSLGQHGYDNADPLMRALFVAHGPDFRSGIVVPEFPNVDVYPLMTRLLRIVPNANDGNYDAVKDMLKADVR